VAADPWVVGKWNVTETHEKSDWSPGGIGKGTSVVTLGPGGYSQLITYNSTGPTGRFSGHGIIAWDPESMPFNEVPLLHSDPIRLAVSLVEDPAILRHGEA
jgi:hypothetical protein